MKLIKQEREQGTEIAKRIVFGQYSYTCEPISVLKASLQVLYGIPRCFGLVDLHVASNFDFDVPFCS